MNESQQDVELTGEKKKEVIKLLKGTPFEKLKVDDHYHLENGNPRHGISLEKSKEIYLQFKKIFCITYRPSKAGRKYCIYYRINKRHSYKLLFFLDRKPLVLFNSIHSGPNIEKRLLRKFGLMR